mmetsp:Transcript_4969/g.8134  ORF Transcript_4969/g.8134 Transcript_4969/m.8134 type:complete len:208 (+) Transcript_4969:2172-2795(+)
MYYSSLLAHGSSRDLDGAVLTVLQYGFLSTRHYFLRAPSRTPPASLSNLVPSAPLLPSWWPLQATLVPYPAAVEAQLSCCGKLPTPPDPFGVLSRGFPRLYALLLATSSLYHCCCFAFSARLLCCLGLLVAGEESWVAVLLFRSLRKIVAISIVGFLAYRLFQVAPGLPSVHRWWSSCAARHLPSLMKRLLIWSHCCSMNQWSFGPP